MKPFYYLCDFPERKNAGKNFVTECPKCGKKTSLYFQNDRSFSLLLQRLRLQRKAQRLLGRKTGL